MVAVILMVVAIAMVTAVEYNVMDYGAKGDGLSDDSGAIAATFRACVIGGGGTIRFPATTQTETRPSSPSAARAATSSSVFMTGPWQVACNNSVVVIEAGVAVRSIANTSGWPIPSWLHCPEPSQGKTSLQAAPFMLAYYASNITITGGGTVDALGAMWWKQQCGNWWCPPGHTSNNPAAWRPFMFRIESSAHVVIDDITFQDPGFWCIVPVHSRDIQIKNTRVTAARSSPNTDGIEPMWSKNVHVCNVNISNGDDCMTVKSGSSNILVEDLNCEYSHGITIGSLWYDDVVNITYRRIVMTNTSAGPRIKGRTQGNASVSNIVFQDITLKHVGVGIEVDMLYETPGSTHKNIGVTATNVAYINISGSVTSSTVASLQCLSERPCGGFHTEDVHISSNGDSEKGDDWRCSNVNLTNVEDTTPVPGASCHQEFR